MACVACRCAVSDDVPRRSFLVAIVVGAILNLINQGDALFGGRAVDWVKIALTFAVPYFVSTYGAVSYHLKMSQAPGAAGLPSGSAPASRDRPAATPGDGYSRR